MKPSLIIVLHFIFLSNIFSIEIDTLRLQLENSVCYADNITETSIKTSGSRLLVYPNPNHGEFNIEFTDIEINKPVELHIYNIQGSTVYRTSIKLQFNTSSLKLDFLKPGIYIIAIRQRDTILVNKLVIF